MPLSSRIHAFIRQNVLGLVAIFIALGGTAYATHPGGENTISTEDLQNLAVTQQKLAGQAVSSGKIAADAVRTPKIRDLAVTPEKLQSLAVKTSKIGGQAVSTSKIGDGAVTNDKLAADSVNSANVADGSLTGADIETGSLGTGPINEDDLFNNDSLDAADVANNSSLGTAEINEGSLNVVEGPSNLQMLFGREQLSGGEAGPASVIFANGRANVNAEKNSSNQCSLTFLNSPFAGVTLTFVREVVNGSAIALTSGTLAQGGTNSTAFFATPIQARWQAWAAGNPSSTGRVITVDAAARPTGTTCDFSAVMTIGA